MRTFALTALILCSQLIGTAQIWVSQESNTMNNLQAVHFVDSLHGCVVGNNGTICATSDGGLNWIVRPSGTTDHIRSVHFIDTLKGFASTASSLLRTTDGGISWSTQHSVNATLDPIFFVHPDTGFVGGRGTMLRTTDGGETWAEQPSGPISPTCMWAHGTDTLFLGGWGGSNNSQVQLLQSNNGGSTWATSYSQGVYGPLNDVFFTDTETGYITFSYFGQGIFYHKMMKTVDGGATWNMIISNTSSSSSSSPTSIIWAIHFVNEQTGYLATENGSILRTMDAGISWDFQVINGFPSLNDLFFVNAQNGYAVGNSGTILKFATNVGVNEPGNGTERSPTLYPNPSSLGKLHIDTDRSILSIDLIGPMGQLIRSYSQNTTVIDVEGLAAGAYVLRLATDEGVEVRTFIKQ